MTYFYHYAVKFVIVSQIPCYFYLQMEHQRIQCEVCLKTYATDASLKTHARSHIDDKFNEALVLKLITKTIENIVSSKTHAADVNEALQSYAPGDNVLKKLVGYLNSHKIGNTELYYNRLFHDLMTKSADYFVDLPKRSAIVLCAKFAESLIAMRNEKLIPSSIITKNLNSKEIAGIQYLGGYVMRKVYSRLKDITPCSDHNKEVMALIMAGKSTENRNTYTDDLSRDGGLWTISEEMEKIFVISEKYFSVQTGGVGIREINIPSLVDKLIQFPPLILTFEQVAASHSSSMDRKIVINTLSALLQLFLRARTFSHTRDIVAKTRQKIVSKKALRKTIKNASVKEITK